MSDEGKAGFSRDPERLPGRGAALLLVGFVAVTALASAASTLVPSRPPSPHKTAAAASSAPRAIGMLEQTIVEAASPGPSLAAEQRRELDGWGWADADRRHARIPIDRAIDLMVQTQGKAAAAAAADAGEPPR